MMKTKPKNVKSKQIVHKNKIRRDHSRSGYNEEQPLSTPDKKQI